MSTCAKAKEAALRSSGASGWRVTHRSSSGSKFAIDMESVGAGIGSWKTGEQTTTSCSTSTVVSDPTGRQAEDFHISPGRGAWGSTRVATGGRRGIARRTLWCPESRVTVSPPGTTMSAVVPTGTVTSQTNRLSCAVHATSIMPWRVIRCTRRRPHRRGESRRDHEPPKAGFRRTKTGHELPRPGCEGSSEADVIERRDTDILVVDPPGLQKVPGPSTSIDPMPGCSSWWTASRSVLPPSCSASARTTAFVRRSRC